LHDADASVICLDSPIPSLVRRRTSYLAGLIRARDFNLVSVEVQVADTVVPKASEPYVVIKDKVEDLKKDAGDLLGLMLMQEEFDEMDLAS
jgi:hypothetical protein